MQVLAQSMAALMGRAIDLSCKRIAVQKKKNPKQSVGASRGAKRT